MSRAEELEGKPIEYNGHRIGRLHITQGAYYVPEPNLIIEDPSVAELLHRHFNPDAPLEIGTEVDFLLDQPVPAGGYAITGRRQTETMPGPELNYEYRVGGDSKWYTADRLRAKFAPTGWIDPNPPQPDPELPRPGSDDDFKGGTRTEL